MQAVYLLALFGLMFTVIASFTVGLGANTMQQKENKLEEQRQAFDDIEFAINNVILKDFTDLRGLGLAAENSVVQLDAAEGSFLARMLPYMRQSRENIAQDPWRSDIRYYAFETATPFCRGDSATTIDHDNDPATDRIPLFSCQVDAPVVYFVMVSAGPDRQFESGPDQLGGAPAPDTLAFLNYQAGGDDLVKSFSTESPMRAHYNNMVNVEEKVAALVLKDYREKVSAFMETPDVRQYIEDEIERRIGDSFFDTPAPGAGPGGTEVMQFNQAFETPSVEVQQLPQQALTPNNDGTVGGTDKGPGQNNDDDPVGGGQNWLPIDITQGEIYGDILTDLQRWGSANRYPRMTGDAQVSATATTTIPASAYGAESEVEFDPFYAAGGTPFRIEYEPDKPWLVQMIRSMINPDETGGWIISTNRVVNGLEDL